MRIDKLAQLLCLKHKIAIDISGLELDLRKKIRILWKYPHELFPILDFCANTDIKKSTVSTPDEQKALQGYLFCRRLVIGIDYLQAHWDTITLGAVKDILLKLVDLIKNNVSSSDNEKGVQFPNVSELIFKSIPTKTKHDVKIRNDQFGKMKTGLSRINSICIDMLKDLHKLELAQPEKFIDQSDTFAKENFNPEINRFSPQSAPLSENDIIDFIRQHGPKYGINDINEWEIALRDDLGLRKQMTTVINALNRGHHPIDAPDVKMQIAEILRRHEESKANNSAMFE